MTTPASDSLAKKVWTLVSSAVPLAHLDIRADEDVEDLSPLSGAHAELVADRFVTCSGVLVAGVGEGEGHVVPDVHGSEGGRGHRQESGGAYLARSVQHRLTKMSSGALIKT